MGRRATMDTEEQPLSFLSMRILIAAVVGSVSALIVALFNTLLETVIEKTPMLIPSVPFLLPLIGALIVGFAILRWIPESGGEGVPSYILSVNHRQGRLSLPATICKVPATIITLGFYGSGGIVGPLTRICAGFGSSLTGAWLKLLKKDRDEYIRIAAICGVSGAVSAIFHSPLGGGFFAAEILRKDNMRYSDLLPSVLAGGFSVALSSFVLKRNPLLSIETPAARSDTATMLWLPVVALVASLIGIIFIFVFNMVSKRLCRLPGGRPVSALAGGALVSLLWLLNARLVLSTSMPLLNAITAGDIRSVTASYFSGVNMVTLLASAILIKIFATSFTVGSGMSGGFTGPLIVIGTASGALMSALTGAAAGSPAYYSFLACSMAAVLGSAMNIPLAAVMITTAIFGSGYIFPAVIGGIISFIIFKPRTIYEYFGVSDVTAPTAAP